MQSDVNPSGESDGVIKAGGHHLVYYKKSSSSVQSGACRAYTEAGNDPFAPTPEGQASVGHQLLHFLISDTPHLQSSGAAALTSLLEGAGTSLLAENIRKQIATFVNENVSVILDSNAAGELLQAPLLQDLLTEQVKGALTGVVAKHRAEGEAEAAMRISDAVNMHDGVIPSVGSYGSLGPSGQSGFSIHTTAMPAAAIPPHGAASGVAPQQGASAVTPTHGGTSPMGMAR